MQDDFENKVKTSLDQSAQSLDADTRKRLADIRRQALSTQTSHVKPTRWLALSTWLPSTSLAFGVLLALFFVAQHKQQSGLDAGHEQIAAFEMLNDVDDLNTENLETLSDPDFYLWAYEQLANESNHAV
jgi:heme/copper-type cytochrome/quinol oxidase subunit 3